MNQVELGKRTRMEVLKVSIVSNGLPGSRRFGIFYPEQFHPERPSECFFRVIDEIDGRHICSNTGVIETSVFFGLFVGEEVSFDEAPVEVQEAITFDLRVGGRHHHDTIYDPEIGADIDWNIYRLVRAIRDLGHVTTYSCEGLTPTFYNPAGTPAYVSIEPMLELDDPMLMAIRENHGYIEEVNFHRHNANMVSNRNRRSLRIVHEVRADGRTATLLRIDPERERGIRDGIDALTKTIRRVSRT